MSNQIMQEEFEETIKQLNQNLWAIRGVSSVLGNSPVSRWVEIMGLFSTLEGHLRLCGNRLGLVKLAKPEEWKDGVKLLAKLVLRELGVEVEGSEGWDGFGKAVDVRNRLAHVNLVSPGHVPREDCATVWTGVEWVVKMLNEKMSEERSPLDLFRWRHINLDFEAVDWRNIESPTLVLICGSDYEAETFWQQALDDFLTAHLDGALKGHITMPTILVPGLKGRGHIHKEDTDASN